MNVLSFFTFVSFLVCCLIFYPLTIPLAGDESAPGCLYFFALNGFIVCLCAFFVCMYVCVASLFSILTSVLVAYFWARLWLLNAVLYHCFAAADG